MRVNRDCTTRTEHTQNLQAICNGLTYWNEVNTDCGTNCLGNATCVSACLQGIWPNPYFAYAEWDPNVGSDCAGCGAAIQTCIANDCVWRLSDGVTNCAQGDPDCSASGPCAPPNSPFDQPCVDCQATAGCPADYLACAGDVDAACAAILTPKN